MRSRLLLASGLVLTFLALTHPAWAWSNGGYSADPNNPDYGTHDWIAERALDWLPGSEKALILTYRAAYLYGTELPDNNQAADGIGDTTLHHIYFFANQTLQDDAAARRARDMQNQALAALSTGDNALAAKWTGAMTHYIADMAVFGHVMGAGTDWGNEQHHSDYEEHIQALTDSPAATSIPVIPAGSLVATAPYDAALALAYDTTFDLTGTGHSAVWMDQHYNWSDPMFTARAYTSINLAIMMVADAVDATWSSITTITTVTTTQQSTTEPTSTSTGNLTAVSLVLINEFEQNPPGEDRGSEWVELFNPTSQPVDIGNWIIYTTHGDIESYVIPAGTSLAAYGFWWTALPGQFIDNEQDSLVLLNTLGQRVDETPNLADQDDNASSWQRVPDGSENWVYAPSTQGIVNVREYPSPTPLALVIVTAAFLILRRRRSFRYLPGSVCRLLFDEHSVSQTRPRLTSPLRVRRLAVGYTTHSVPRLGR